MLRCKTLRGGKQIRLARVLDVTAPSETTEAKRVDDPKQAERIMSNMPHQKPIFIQPR